jgi:hypothetical protein
MFALPYQFRGMANLLIFAANLNKSPNKGCLKKVTAASVAMIASSHYVSCSTAYRQKSWLCLNQELTRIKIF